MAKIAGDRRVVGHHIHVRLEADIGSHGPADAVGPARNRGAAVDRIDLHDRGVRVVHGRRRFDILRDGRVEQWADPATVYRDPVSIDVARLFGDPTINLVPCKLEMNEAGGHVTLFGRHVPISGAFAHAAGRDLIAGLRPEHVIVTETEAPDAMPFDLDAVMPVNVRSVLYLRGAAGEELLATVGESDAGRFGRGHRQVWVRFAPSDLLLFDAASGQRIAPLVH